MPKIVLVAEGEQIGVALAGGDSFPQPTRKVRVNAHPFVEPDKVNRAIAEIRDDRSAVVLVRSVGADEDFQIPMALRYKRLELARQEIGIRPIKAKYDENTTILADAHDS